MRSELPSFVLGSERNDATVLIWRVNLDVSATGVTECRTLLSPDECDRAERYRFDEHRRRFVVARAALRMILARQLGIDAKAITFDYGPSGKPYVYTDTGEEMLNFSVSHSGPLALVALSQVHRIGIDLEQVRLMDDTLSRVADYFCPVERAFLDNLPVRERSEAFFRIWVRKEAILKATGVGIGVGLDSVCVSSSSDDDMVTMKSMSRPFIKKWWVPILSVSGYAAALACEVVEP